jgi:hypothetical protein
MTRKFERIQSPQFLAGACAVVFGASVVTEPAQAQFVNPPHPAPPPVTNPSTPYTVPQPSYTPATPAAPNAAPGYQVSSPGIEPIPRAHRRTHAAKAAPATTRVAKAHVARTRAVHRRTAVTDLLVYRPGPIIFGPPPIAYSYVGYYGCAWQRSWDGYWFRTSPCS